MENIVMPKGDKGYNLVFTMTDSDGTALDLTGFTVSLKVWAPGVSGTLIIDGTCTTDDATTGIYKYTLTGTEFTTAGRYLAELEAVSGSSIVDSTEQFLIIVKESG